MLRVFSNSLSGSDFDPRCRFDARGSLILSSSYPTFLSSTPHPPINSHTPRSSFSSSLPPAENIVSDSRANLLFLSYVCRNGIIRNPGREKTDGQPKKPPIKLFTRSTSRRKGLPLLRPRPVRRRQQGTTATRRRRRRSPPVIP